MIGKKLAKSKRRVCFISATLLHSNGTYKKVPPEILKNAIFFFGSKRYWIWPSNDAQVRESKRQPTKYLKFDKEFKDMMLEKEKDGLLYFLKPKKDYKLVSKFLEGIKDPFCGGKKYSPLILDDEWWMKKFNKQKDGVFRVDGDSVVGNYKGGFHDYNPVRELLYQSNKTMVPVLTWDSYVETLFKKCKYQ